MKLILFIIVVAIIYVGYRNSLETRSGSSKRDVEAEGPAQEVGKVIDRGLNVAGKVVEKAGQRIQDVTQDTHSMPTPRAS